MQLMIQFAVWDKIKLLNDAAEFQSSNLAHLLAHLFLTSSMAISILKVTVTHNNNNIGFVESIS